MKAVRILAQGRREAQGTPRPWRDSTGAVRDDVLPEEFDRCHHLCVRNGLRGHQELQLIHPCRLVKPDGI